MQKKELISIVDSVLTPMGFKRKGNTWSSEGQELTKVVNLQKSSFGNHYYINYGFNLKGLDYDGTAMHIFRGLTAQDRDGKPLLDFEQELNAEYRTSQINQLLQTVLVKELNAINSVADIREELSSRPHLNDVLLKVKEFLDVT